MAEPMNSDQMREAFLAYFEGKGHLRVASGSLIPVGDPTLLLTSAGMVQFKPYFSGETEPPNRRLTSSQKSFRTVDIDEVGDAGHLTMFEMLGNFSIGDYFKKEAIEYALECCAYALGLPRERFAITVHDDDDESDELWRQAGMPPQRIYRFGDADNWWGPAGLEGPCGPCSELHYDFGPDRGCGKEDCAPNCTNPIESTGQVCMRYIELWNLVFMQFYHHLDGTRTPLPAPSVDTGMGLERLAVVLQGTPTIYETDLFYPFIKRVEELSRQELRGRGIALRHEGSGRALPQRHLPHRRRGRARQRGARLRAAARGPASHPPRPSPGPGGGLPGRGGIGGHREDGPSIPRAAEPREFSYSRC